MIPSAALCIDAAVNGAAKIANAFEWPEQPPKIAPSLRDLHPQLIHGSVGGPSRVFIQKSMSLGSAIFAQLTVDCPITLQWAISAKNALYLGGLGPPSNIR